MGRNTGIGAVGCLAHFTRTRPTAVPTIAEVEHLTGASTNASNLDTIAATAHVIRRTGLVIVGHIAHLTQPCTIANSNNRYGAHLAKAGANTPNSNTIASEARVIPHACILPVGYITHFIGTCLQLDNDSGGINTTILGTHSIAKVILPALVIARAILPKPNGGRTRPHTGTLDTLQTVITLGARVPFAIDIAIIPGLGIASYEYVHL
mmetsp:Transcript_3019/g.6607  ORF Transcript_3019/g.6607 Transcript_3019/m.6607 type:complete len:208 (-) Transcript_3019:1300-1923(-)